MDKYFTVKNALVQEPKHEIKMGDAIWLYEFLLSYANRSARKDKTIFYPETYAKARNQSLEEVLGKLEDLKKGGYLCYEMLEKTVYLVNILKPIKIK